ncbi:uncharacterized protein J4E78_006633 [Alternaria triticimaculans]|uniref:uncharacterized protein n=1 Tax=Alternaria triticimaculans TaxID=297637 RepID=UPI0020C44F24|nr:uncharacterized protein J4E78_006633 [Alternaria triticimaculans]XP_049243338.1 uncharacterized protein J4E84_006475 [Alternaria hordeiaustralica]KAI4656742.1 hypothetical protein J4E78_006633 [Alternaria triticimaculans]KAI4684485.1 hypothetical protein J4E84_006475 [Alternaria hordeiaustralica]
MGLSIALHCPTINKTKSAFGLVPSKKHDEILQDIRSLFGIDYAATYDIRGKPIDDICACKPGDLVQVATEKFEIMVPYSPRNCIFYNGEEMEKITDAWADGYGKPWKELNDSQRCEHITSLGTKAEDSVLVNTIRITRPYVEVQQELKDIAAAAPEDMDTKQNLGTAIFTNWGKKWDMLLPPTMKPANDEMSAKVLRLLVALSSFTHGSARLVRRYLVEAVNARLSGPGGRETDDALLRDEDIVHVIGTLYEKADSLAAEMALAKEKKVQKKVKDKTRKQAWRARKKAARGKTSSDVDDLADLMDVV